MKFGILIPLACLAAAASPALAQSANPFQPSKSGASQEQIRAAVAAELAAQNNAAPMPNPADVGAMPSQPGATPVAEAVVLDPVGSLFDAGGTFVGCVGRTPVFRDKAGRRAYFTSEELKNSHEARRFARC